MICQLYCKGHLLSNHHSRHTSRYTSICSIFSQNLTRERARSFYSIKYIFSRVVAVGIQRVFLSVYIYFFHQISYISSLCSRFSIIRADCLVARMSSGKCNAGAFLTHRLQFLHDLTAHPTGAVMDPDPLMIPVTVPA